MKALVLSTVFPNPAQPTYGLFVFERARHAARHCPTCVVAPIPWYQRKVRGSVPGQEMVDGMTVEHPTWFYVPRFFKFLDGLFLFLSVLSRVTRIRRRFDFDLIDAHFAFPDGFAAVLLGWWFKRPVVITERGTLVPLWFYRLRRWAMGWALRRANRVIAVSDYLAQRTKEFGVHPERVEVVENGVDAVRFTPRDQAEVRTQLGLPVSGKLLLSVGRLSPEKAFHRVLNVLPALRQEFPDVSFVIVGGPERGSDYEAQLRRMVVERGLSDYVAFVGPRLRDEVVLWLNAADVLVLSSEYEGCPNVVWEALACGRPVVATKVGHVERMVPPYAGNLVEDGDDASALRCCLSDALRRRWDHQKIRAHAERHTWQRVARRVVRAWRLAVDGRSRRSPAALMGERKR